MVIPGLQFDNVKEKSLREIWETSSSFRKFRGEDWMHEPCKSCDRRHKDFAGCRASLSPVPAIRPQQIRCVPAPTRSNVDAILTYIQLTVHGYPEEKLQWVYRKESEMMSSTHARSYQKFD